MNRTKARTLRLIVVGTLWLIGSRSVMAQSACTASDISAQEVACPAGGACAITKAYAVADACVLDFGTRSVTLTPTGRLSIGSGTVTLMAGSLTLQPQAGLSIDGRGTGVTAPTNQGGTMRIISSGPVTIEKSGGTRAKIDVSANLKGGTIEITATGTVTVNGSMTAGQLSGGTSGGGGSIVVATQADFVSGDDSQINAIGGTAALTGGGRIIISAEHKIDLGDFLDVSGAAGGEIGLYAGIDVTARGLRGNGAGETGRGGQVFIIAQREVKILDEIVLMGSADDLFAGGDGGYVGMSAHGGNVFIFANVIAEGAGLFGQGGELAITTAGDLFLLGDTQISVSTSSSENGGGAISINAGLGASIGGELHADGGFAGGSIDLSTRSAVDIVGIVSAKGIAAAGAGGEVNLQVGTSLVIHNEIDVGGGGCGDSGCGQGGHIEIDACDIQVAATGHLLARAAELGGDIALTARNQAVILGDITSTATAPSGSNGSNTIRFQLGNSPLIFGSISPTASQQGLPSCTAAAPTNCLIPCPTCGNSVVEYPETCDGGDQLDCDGCSQFCQVENCGSGFTCSCHSRLGCGELIACHPAPTDTPTPTNTPSPTPTPSPAIVVADAAARPGGTLCLAARLENGAAPLSTVNDIGYSAASPFSLSFSSVLIHPAIGPGTAPDKHVSGVSNSGSDRFTVAGVNMVGIPDGFLYTAKYAIPAGAPPGAYKVPLPAPGFEVVLTTCSGDCDGNGFVSLGEVQRCASMFLGQPLCDVSQPYINCPVADADNLGSVSLSEVEACVVSYLVGCPD